jgi:hypothetical protein
VAITTAELHDRMWNRITNGAVGIVADEAASTLTVTRAWKNNALTTSGTINLANTAYATAWCWESAENSVQPGGTGLAVTLSLTGNLPAGTQIYSLCTYLSTSGVSGAIPG